MPSMPSIRSLSQSAPFDRLQGDLADPATGTLAHHAVEELIEDQAVLGHRLRGDLAPPAGDVTAAVEVRAPGHYKGCRILASASPGSGVGAPNLVGELMPHQ